MRRAEMPPVAAGVEPECGCEAARAQHLRGEERTRPGHQLIAKPGTTAVDIRQAKAQFVHGRGLA